MTRYQTITRTLKALLRERGLRYRDVAAQVGLSESGLKKALNAEDGSVGRIDAICAALGLTLAEVLEEAGADEPGRLVLTAHQNAVLAEDPRRWFFLTALLDHGFDLAAVCEVHGLDAATAGTYVDVLERLGMIARTEGGVRSLLPPHRGVQVDTELGRAAVWPLQTGLIDHVRRRMRQPDDRPHRDLDLLALGQGSYLPQTALSLKRALADVVDQHAERARREHRHDPHAPRVRIGTLIAVAPFELADAIRF